MTGTKGVLGVKERAYRHSIGANPPAQAQRGTWELEKGEAIARVRMNNP